MCEIEYIMSVVCSYLVVQLGLFEKKMILNFSLLLRLLCLL